MQLKGDEIMGNVTKWKPSVQLLSIFDFLGNTLKDK